MSPALASPSSARHRPNRSVAAWSLVAAGLVLLAISTFSFSIHLRNNVYLRDATAFIFDGPGDDESKAIALAHFVAVEARQPIDEKNSSVLARLEHQLPFELSPVTVLRHGFAFSDARRFGPCGQMSRTIRAAAGLHGIRSHKVLIDSEAGEHAMVALEVNGKFRLFDPTFDFYWVDREGHVASFDEVRSDPAIFAQIFRKVPSYPYRLDHATFFRWGRLGKPGLWVRDVLTRVMGPEWVAGVDTPMLYERPWWGYAWISLIGAVILLVPGVGRLLARRSRLDFQPAVVRAEPRPAT